MSGYGVISEVSVRFSLRGPAVAFHPHRPGRRLGAVGFAHGFDGRFARVLGVHLRAHDAATPDDFARFGAHGQGITAAFAAAGKCH